MWAIHAVTWFATGKARQITQDHTLVNEQRKMGLISTEDIPNSDARHVLIRSLGPEMFVSPDTTALTLQAGDVLVLCTDGLHDEMHGETIAEIVSQKKTMDEVARELVAKPSRSTAATTPPRRLSASAPSSKSACTADAHTGCPPDRNPYGILALPRPFPIEWKTRTTRSISHDEFLRQP